MGQLTCGYCRHTPATHVIVAHLTGVGRHMELVCQACGESSFEDAQRICSSVHLIALEPQRVVYGGGKR